MGFPVHNRSHLVPSLPDKGAELKQLNPPPHPKYFRGLRNILAEANVDTSHTSLTPASPFSVVFCWPSSLRVLVLTFRMFLTPSLAQHLGTIFSDPPSHLSFLITFSFFLYTKLLYTL